MKLTPEIMCALTAVVEAHYSSARDDYSRSQLAFSKLSEKEWDQMFSEPGRTRREIHIGYLNSFTMATRVRDFVGELSPEETDNSTREEFEAAVFKLVDRYSAGSFYGLRGGTLGQRIRLFFETLALEREEFHDRNG